MNAATAEVDTTSRLAVALVRLRASRLELSRQEARRHIARELHVSGGTLINLIRGTAKGVRGYLRDQIAALVMREIRAEISRLHHEEQLVRQIGGGDLHVDLAEIETSICALKALIAERSAAAI